MTNSIGKREKKLLQMQQDMHSIIRYIKAKGPASRELIIQHCKISIKRVGNILRKLQDAGLDGEFIHTIRSAFGPEWAMGKEEKKIAKPRKSRSKEIIKLEGTIKLEELPERLQRMFGFISAFEPPTGRRIKEHNHPQALRTHKHAMGSGSCAYLNLCADGV